MSIFWIGEHRGHLLWILREYSVQKVQILDGDRGEIGRTCSFGSEGDDLFQVFFHAVRVFYDEVVAAHQILFFLSKFHSIRKILQRSVFVRRYSFCQSNPFLKANETPFHLLSKMDCSDKNCVAYLKNFGE